MTVRFECNGKYHDQSSKHEIIGQTLNISYEVFKQVILKWMIHKWSLYDL